MGARGITWFSSVFRYSISNYITITSFSLYDSFIRRFISYFSIEVFLNCLTVRVEALCSSETSARPMLPSISNRSLHKAAGESNWVKLTSDHTVVPRLILLGALLLFLFPVLLHDLIPKYARKQLWFDFIAELQMLPKLNSRLWNEYAFKRYGCWGIALPLQKLNC
jgi:hypothetical protein